MVFNVEIEDHRQDDDGEKVNEERSDRRRPDFDLAFSYTFMDIIGSIGSRRCVKIIEKVFFSGVVMRSQCVPSLTHLLVEGGQNPTAFIAERTIFNRLIHCTAVQYAIVITMN